MPLVACPTCGEDEDLRGRPSEHICSECGATEATSSHPVPAEPDWKRKRAELGIDWRQGR